MRFCLFPITDEVVTTRKEDVEGAETREIQIPYISSVAIQPFESVSAGQDIETIDGDSEAQSVVPQAEGVISIWSCRRFRASRDDCSVLLQDPGATPLK